MALRTIQTSTITDSAITTDKLASTAIADKLGYVPVSPTQLALKAPIDSPTFTGPVGGITAAMVGLPNANNTADIDKPVSTLQQTAIGSITGFKNRIINGDMRIDQRNAGASVTPTDGQYTLDRWLANVSQASKLTTQRNAGSIIAPAGFTNYLGVTSSAATSVGTGDYFSLRQVIEGFNIADLGWGTASAQSVIVSFWIRSSLTGMFGGSLVNGGPNRSYPFTYTISSPNTWEQKTVTIAGDTSGTWNTDNSGGIRVNFGLGVGSTLSGAAGAWAAGNFFSATGATSVVGTSGATFYITGVQLEKGSTATSFDYRDYGREFIMCQRYYQTVWGMLGIWDATNSCQLVMQFQTPMRIAPTVTIPAVLKITDFVANDFTQSAVAFSTYNATNATVRVGCSNFSGATANRMAWQRTDSAPINFSAEL